MSNNLRSSLETLAANFAASVVGLIRSASLEDLLTETREAKAGRPKRVPAAPRTSPSSGSGRLKRRSAEDVAKVLDKVVSLVKKNKTGLRAEQIREQLSMRPNEMPRILGEGLAKKMLKKKGQKRATTYFAA
ncbi:MAG TPA: hypothetical protein VKU41_10710 [Polyangiaceae bacterium]|nr:hypothetical protein [Polyangiaceae bacterium]